MTYFFTPFLARCQVNAGFVLVFKLHGGEVKIWRPGKWDQKKRRTSIVFTNGLPLLITDFDNYPTQAR